MSGNLYTREELIQKIKEADAAIAKAMQADSYSINSGMSSQSVKNQSIDALLKARQHWVDLLEEIDELSGRSPVLIPVRGR